MLAISKCTVHDTHSTNTNISTSALYSEVNSHFLKKCNSQTTSPGGHPSIPEADTVVERSQIWFRMCKFSHLPAVNSFCMHFAALASKEESKNAPPT